MRLRAATLCCLTLCSLWICTAQQPNSAAEEQSLNAALADAGASPTDFTRALENHLAKYPQTLKRAELERDEAQREHDRLQRENDRLRQQIDHLKRQVDEARRAGFRQAAEESARALLNTRGPFVTTSATSGY